MFEIFTKYFKKFFGPISSTSFILDSFEEAVKRSKNFRPQPPPDYNRRRQFQRPFPSLVASTATNVNIDIDSNAATSNDEQEFLITNYGEISNVFRQAVNTASCFMPAITILLCRLTILIHRLLKWIMTERQQLQRMIITRLL